MDQNQNKEQGTPGNGTPPENATPAVGEAAVPMATPTETAAPPREVQSPNPPHQIESMEVHKHPHHVAHKKKWPEYLLEFFMIFFAVFLGFLAENFREHTVAREREKGFMETLVEDIQLDTTDLRSDIIFKTRIEARADSLFTLFSMDKRDSVLGDIYFLARRLTRANNFYYHDRTIQQLKNSGGLMLVKNKQVSNAIILYDGYVREVQSQYELEGQIRQNIRNDIGKIFDEQVIHAMEVYIGDSLTIVKPANNPPLVSTDRQLVNELLNQVQYLKSVYVVTRSLEKRLITRGGNLVNLIKKEYHFD